MVQGGVVCLEMICDFLDRLWLSVLYVGKV